MNASSESGECASLISCVLPLACRVAISLVVAALGRPPADTLAQGGTAGETHRGRNSWANSSILSSENTGDSPKGERKISTTAQCDQVQVWYMRYSFYFLQVYGRGSAISGSLAVAVSPCLSA